jgi:hypothetical protein
LLFALNIQYCENFTRTLQEPYKYFTRTLQELYKNFTRT